jgi:hypothetical protein
MLPFCHSSISNDTFFEEGQGFCQRGKGGMGDKSPPQSNDSRGDISLNLIIGEMFFLVLKI